MNEHKVCAPGCSYVYMYYTDMTFFDAVHYVYAKIT